MSDETKLTFVIERAPEEECVSYWDVAKLIAKSKHPVGSEEWTKEAAAFIKKHDHQGKYSVYRRLKSVSDDHDFLKNVIDVKVKTHREILDEWETGKWKP